MRDNYFLQYQKKILSFFIRIVTENKKIRMISMKSNPSFLSYIFERSDKVQSLHLFFIFLIEYILIYLPFIIYFFFVSYLFSYFLSFFLSFFTSFFLSFFFFSIFFSFFLSDEQQYAISYKRSFSSRTMDTPVCCDTQIIW